MVFALGVVTVALIASAGPNCETAADQWRAARVAFADSSDKFQRMRPATKDLIECGDVVTGRSMTDTLDLLGPPDAARGGVDGVTERVVLEPPLGADVSRELIYDLGKVSELESRAEDLRVSFNRRDRVASLRVSSPWRYGQ